MYCPKCKGEFRTGFTECGRCGAALVAEPPTEPVPEYVELETVFVAPDEYVLMLAKSRLEAEGIRCTTRNELRAFGIYEGDFGGAPQLQVSTGDADRARRILDEIEGRRADSE